MKQVKDAVGMRIKAMRWISWPRNQHQEVHIAALHSKLGRSVSAPKQEHVHGVFLAQRHSVKSNSIGEHLQR